MSTPTLNQLILDSLRRRKRSDLLWHKARGVWHKIPTETFLRRVAAVARALGQLGIQKGDRVAVFSENRPEWHIADLAILGLGAIHVPLYFAELPERLRSILADSQSRVCFVSGRQQLQKLKKVWSDLPHLEKVITFLDVEGDPKIVPWQEVAREDGPEDWLRGFERSARAQKLDDVATLVYTSGSAGQPKGVLLTQLNLASDVTAALGPYRFTEDDLALSWLPLCHTFERMCDYGYLASGLALAYTESVDKVVPNLHEVRPTVMAVVPRFLEKFNVRLEESLERAPDLKRKLFRWAIQVGRQTTPYRLRGEALPLRLALPHRLADFLVYRNFRAQLGGRLRFLISGGGALAKELNEKFHALGVTIYEGYGLTETSPVIAANVPGASKPGSVGKPIPGVEVKIAEDGEILVRGPNVMKGYHGLEKLTREVLRNGWFHTGDIGVIDPEGFLTITDRKKDIFKNAGGKMIIPQSIENRLRQSPYVQNAVLVGDSRNYLVALLVANLGRLRQHAEENGIPFASPAELLTRSQVRSLMEDEIEKVNSGLAKHERVRRFALLEQDFTFDNGLLTFTQKVRRRQVEERYRDLIEQLYNEKSKPTA